MATQNVAFRVDASSQIGTGHFMRSLTLADALKQGGASVLFVSRCLPDYLRDLLVARGFAHAMLDVGFRGEHGDDNLTHSRWLSSCQASDAKSTAQELPDGVWDWLVVDHYALDIRWEAVLRRRVKNILVIDDLADRQHDCDILLDQNLYPDMNSRYDRKVPAHCRLLLGPRYLLLREEFRKLRKHVKMRTGNVERLLVVFGGVDADNYTGCVLEVLSDFGYQFQQVDVVIGAQHPIGEQIVATCSKMGFVCHQQTTQMAKLMATADLAIGACGFTSYEFAAMQLPAILIPVTEIQTTVARELSVKGIACALFPQVGGDIIDDISITLKKVVESSSYRTSMIMACRDFLDADGACRVVDEMIEYKER